MAPELAETEVLPGVGAAVSRETVRLYLRAFGRGLEGAFDAQVEASRRKLSDAFDGEFIAIVERETGRPVQTHLTHIKVPANLAVHFFLFDTQSTHSGLIPD